MKNKTRYLFSIMLFLLLSNCWYLSPEFRKLQKAEIFFVSEDKETVFLDGVVNSSALEKIKAILSNHPNIKTLNIINCEGSIDDEVNLKLGQYIYAKGLRTHLMDNGIIASGGTDLFLAGNQRTKGTNTQIGVHSWRGIFKKATDFPAGHKHHIPYIDYYMSVGFSKAEAETFYYFTINSAPPEDMYFMTDDEIEKYGFLKN